MAPALVLLSDGTINGLWGGLVEGAPNMPAEGFPNTFDIPLLDWGAEGPPKTLGFCEVAPNMADGCDGAPKGF